MLHEVQLLRRPYLEVVLTEGRRYVHHPRPLIQTDKVPPDHVERRRLAGLVAGPPLHPTLRKLPDSRHLVCHRVVQRLVSQPHQLAPLHRPDRLVPRRQQLAHKGLGHDQPLRDGPLRLVLNNSIVRFGVYGQGRVAGQGPGGGRPGEDEGRQVRSAYQLAGLVAVIVILKVHTELHEYGHVLRLVVVALGHLMVA